MNIKQIFLYMIVIEPMWTALLVKKMIELIIY